MAPWWPTEVRKLAERTTNSTHEISITIDKIQNGTRDAIASMNSGVSQVGSGADLARQAGESISEIKTGAGQVVMVINDISLAIKEQSQACSDIAQNVERIALMAEENSAAVGQTSMAAKELENISAALEKTVGYFRV